MLTDRCDTAFFVANSVKNTLFPNNQYKINIHLPDSKSLFKTIKTVKLAVDRRRRVEISAFREICDLKEIEAHWISKHQQFSDVLTQKFLA